MSSSSSRQRGLTISYLELKALTYAVKHFPERTPKRWELIATFVSEATLDKEDVSPPLQLSKRGGPTFSPVPSDCQKAHEILLCDYPAVLEQTDFSDFEVLYQHPQKDAFKPLVLMPAGVSSCCGMPTLVRNRPSYPIVYTTRGTYIAACFHAECRSPVCKKKYYINHYEIPNGEETQQYFYDPNHDDHPYFQVSSQTIFEKKLLEDITNNITISGASFESRAEVYNENFAATDLKRLTHLQEYCRDRSKSWSLNERRVEDAWFLWILVNILQNEGKLATTNFYTPLNTSHRKDIDSIADEAWHLLCSKTSPWVHHVCNKKGCAEGTFLCFQDNMECIYHYCSCSHPQDT